MGIPIGIEIGGTKIQVGAGMKDKRPLGLARTEIEAEIGAEGIRAILPELIEKAIQKAGSSTKEINGIGVGFGGPVDSQHGITITSHQVQGWDGFPLKKFLHEQFHVPVFVQNDASIAGYAEAKLGAGAGLQRVFYMTIGSGIGGGLINAGIIDEGQGLGAAEIGHTWIPDPDTGEPEKLEHICSGWSIGRRAQEAIEAGEHSLMVELCESPDRIDAKTVYAAVERDDLLATAILDETCQGLALAICNIIALLHPERVIIGGGVSLMGALFWDNLQEKVRRHVFAPYANHYEIVPAVLEEKVVVIGAILLGDSSEKGELP